MLRPAATIARYTLLEALRNRLPWLVALALAVAAGLGGFLDALALTESAQLQAAVLAALLRLAGVFLVAGYVSAGMARDGADHGRLLLLALPQPRAAYVLGKLLGYAALAALPALAFGALGLRYAPFGQALLWTASLLCELWIVAAFALLCSLTLNQLVPALAATLFFYLLARVAGTLQLLGHGHAMAHGALQRVMTAGVDAIALLLPRLDDYTRSAWLVYHNGSAAELAAIAIQTTIYVGLAGAAALFDFYRKQL